MVRKLVKTLLSLLLMAPAAALALGLGDVKLHSALNQQLDAEIELLSVEPGQVDDIEVTLASADAFSRIGLDRPAVLRFIRFDVQQRQSGHYYIKATSREIIREPFLDFLIEVNWPSGRVLREYTLLLDPPVRHEESSPSVTSPAAGAPAPAKSASSAAPSGTVSTQPAPGTSRRPVPVARPEASAPAAQKGVVYGPVESSDTLWAIARKLRPSKDISIQQVMMALLKANPYAFFDNNINRLKKGYVLRVDDPALFSAMSQAEAAREVSRQTRAWQDYRAAAAGKAGERKPASDKPTAAASASAGKSEPKLKLVAPDGESRQAGASDGGQPAEGEMDEQLMLALESSAAQRKENEQLQSRVEELENQLNDMQRLMQLKDADLAALQEQLREQGDAVELPSDRQQPASGEMTEESKQAAAGGTEPEAADKAPIAEKPATDSRPAVEEKPEPAKEPAPKPKPKVQPKPAPQPSFIEGLMQDPMMLAAGGGTFVLLLILLVVLIRRRRKGGFQESILSGGTSSMLSAREEEGNSETSFLSDLAISGMGSGAIAADEGEVDPLTEADVFMAYGRNQQAEDVLKKALESNPERPDVVAKLLEVYHATNNREQFESLIGEWGEKLKGDEELWSKVAPMGHELMPDNELFAGAEEFEAPDEEPAAKPEPLTDDVLDIGLDLDELTAEMESEGSDDSLDFGMDLDLEEEKKSGEKPQDEQGESDFDMDFDLGEQEEKVGEEPEQAAEESGQPASEDVSTDLDFDLGELGELGGEEPAADEKPVEEEVSKEASDDLGDLDFELGELESEPDEPNKEEGDEGELSFDLDMGEESAEPAEEAAESAPVEEKASKDELGDMDLDSLDFGDFGLDEGTESVAETDGEDSATGESESFELSDLESGDLDDFGDLGDLEDEDMIGDSDEVATKLDLASAYIEMGDSEGARTMLEDVVENGMDEQKQQAQELLGKL